MTTLGRSDIKTNWLCVSNTLEIDKQRLCVLWARMNHLEAYLMVLSRKVMFKVLRVAIQKCKIANVIVRNF